MDEEAANRTQQAIEYAMEGFEKQALEEARSGPLYCRRDSSSESSSLHGQNRRERKKKAKMGCLIIWRVSRAPSDEFLYIIIKVLPILCKE